MAQRHIAVVIAENRHKDAPVISAGDGLVERKHRAAYTSPVVAYGGGLICITDIIAGMY